MVIFCMKILVYKVMFVVFFFEIGEVLGFESILEFVCVIEFVISSYLYFIY